MKLSALTTVFLATTTASSKPFSVNPPTEHEQGSIGQVNSCQQEVYCVAEGTDYKSQLMNNVSYLFAWQAAAYLPQYFLDPWTHFENYSNTYKQVGYNLDAMKGTFVGRGFCLATWDTLNVNEHIARYYGKLFTTQILGFLEVPKAIANIPIQAMEYGFYNMLCDNLDHRRLEFFGGTNDAVIQACARAGRPVPLVHGGRDVSFYPLDSVFPIPAINNSFTEDLAIYHNMTSTLFAYQSLAGMQYTASVINLCYAENTWRAFNNSSLLRGEVVEEIMCSVPHRMQLIKASDLDSAMTNTLSKMFAFQLFHASGSEAYLQYICQQNVPDMLAHVNGKMGAVMMDSVLIQDYIMAHCRGVNHGY